MLLWAALYHVACMMYCRHLSMGFHVHLSATNELEPLREITQSISCFQKENSELRQTFDRPSWTLQKEIKMEHVTLLDF